MKPGILPFLLLFTACNLPAAERRNSSVAKETSVTPTTFKEGTWPYFLQHLPLKKGAILDYRGNPVTNQGKAVMIVNYDVGTKDLQQCADALIRLRSEYLFATHHNHDISFHFTSGHRYAFDSYCAGLRPVVQGNQVTFSPLAESCEPSHTALRNYLDIIYTYAGTISLAKELHPSTTITAGTIIMLPGSPGHCTIVVDEATTDDGEKVYKLAEGYSPAQSIYILRSTAEALMGEWQPLTAGSTIRTASCIFYTYRLGVFE